MLGHRRRSSVLRENREAAGIMQRLMKSVVSEPALQGKRTFSLTPKAKRLQELPGQGKSFNKAFTIADREYSSDGMSLKPQRADASNAILASGVPQMGEVQI